MKTSTSFVKYELRVVKSNPVTSFSENLVVVFTYLFERKEGVKFEKLLQGKVDEIKREMYFDKVIVKGWDIPRLREGKQIW